MKRGRVLQGFISGKMMNFMTMLFGRTMIRLAKSTSQDMSRVLKGDDGVEHITRYVSTVKRDEVVELEI